VHFIASRGAARPAGREERGRRREARRRASPPTGERRRPRDAAPAKSNTLATCRRGTTSV